MNNIKEARLSRGMSQAGLAKAVGVSPSAIGMIERGEGEPSLKVLKRLKKALGYGMEYLLGHPLSDLRKTKNTILSFEDFMEFLEYKVGQSESKEKHKDTISSSENTPPLFKLLMMDDPKLAEIVRTTTIVGEHDVMSHGKLISISPAKLELFHAALKAILEIGG